MLMNGDEVDDEVVCCLGVDDSTFLGLHTTRLCSPERTPRCRCGLRATRQLPGSAGGSLDAHGVSLLASGGSAVPSGDQGLRDD